MLMKHLRVSAWLALAAVPRLPGQVLAPDAPLGLRGANVEVEMTRRGQGQRAHQRWRLALPGVFEDPWLPLRQLSSTVRWQVAKEQLAVQVDNTRFANADAQGTLRASWRTSDPARSGSRSRFPGVLDLSGNLSRADGTRVHRYLPLAIPPEARHYVRDAVVAGSSNHVDFRVRGDLHDMPFNDPRQGEFRIAARVQGVTMPMCPPICKLRVNCLARPDRAGR